jgi:arginyl-tRNA synthetase
MDVVVVEEDYIIARLSGQDAVRVQKMSLKMETFKEEELVQRLIKVVMKKKSDLQELSNTGIDIWEVKEDTVLAQAYDKYIRQIQEKGYAVEIVEKNILNVVKELNQK